MSKSEPFEGAINLHPTSGLRKLMRAARRGRLPVERKQIIGLALESAKKRYKVYQNSYSWNRPPP